MQVHSGLVARPKNDPPQTTYPTQMCVLSLSLTQLHGHTWLLVLRTNIAVPRTIPPTPTQLCRPTTLNAKDPSGPTAINVPPDVKDSLYCSKYAAAEETG